LIVVKEAFLQNKSSLRTKPKFACNRYSGLT
jgi:hypothetical protein